jgi:hypothetical protein
VDRIERAAEDADFFDLSCCWIPWGLIGPVLVFLKDQDFSLTLALKIPDGAKHMSGGWDLRSELMAASLERCV